jgi:hypothetical protein
MNLAYLFTLDKIVKNQFLEVNILPSAIYMLAQSG